MKKTQHNNEDQKFWSGYALGACTAGIVAFAFGTKTGRHKIKHIIDIIESHKNPAEIVDSMSDIVSQIVYNKPEHKKSDINQVISKMKTISSEEHKSKKFIVK